MNSRLVYACGVVALCSLSAESNADLQDKEKMLREALAPAVVVHASYEARGEYPRGSWGSGFLIASSEWETDCRLLAVTNYHVISSALNGTRVIGKIEVKEAVRNSEGAQVGHQTVPAKALHWSADKDLALLELKRGRCDNRESARLASKDEPITLFRDVWRAGAVRGDVDFMQLDPGVINRFGKIGKGLITFGISTGIEEGQSGSAVYAYNQHEDRYVVVGAAAARSLTSPMTNVVIPISIIRSFVDGYFTAGGKK